MDHLPSSASEVRAAPTVTGRPSPAARIRREWLEASQPIAVDDDPTWSNEPQLADSLATRPFPLEEA